MKRGGRERWLQLAKYRPDLSFDVDPSPYYGALPIPEMRDTDFDEIIVNPGETCETAFWLRSPASWMIPRVQVGSTFRVMEGGRAVANGVITDLYQAGD